MTDALISSAYSQALEVIASVEPRIAEATRQELADQRASLKLIASENYASPAVLLTMGTWFSDKYAEGTIGHRFYAGCQNVDTVESVAAEHARELFGAPYAYVQPHSGIDANLVAYWSILAHRVETPGLEKLGAKNVNELSEDDWESLRHELGNQRLLGMSLDAGGHLTHGFRPNISGKMFHQQQYGTDPETGLLDYDAVAAQGPRVQAAGARRRLLGVPAPGELREDARDRRRGRRHPDGRHGALRRAGGRQGVHRRRGPRPVRPRHHHHDPQVAARPARRAGARAGGVRRRRRPRLPDGARWPALAHDGGEGGRAGRGPDRRVPDLRPEHRRQRQVAGRGVPQARRRLVTGGTDNHIVLLDVTSFGLTGRQAETALLDAGVVTNRNSIPSDPNGAWYTSGIRLGTPALTTRGFGHDEFDTVAELIVHVLSNTEPGTTKAGGPSKASYKLAEGVADKVKGASAEMLDKYPLYPGLELS